MRSISPRMTQPTPILLVYTLPINLSHTLYVFVPFLHMLDPATSHSFDHLHTH